MPKNYSRVIPEIAALMFPMAANKSLIEFTIEAIIMYGDGLNRVVELNEMLARKADVQEFKDILALFALANRRG